MGWRSDHDFNALRETRREARKEDPIVPPVTWSDYVDAFINLIAPPDSLMRLARAFISLKMAPGQSTDELAMLVHDTYR